MCICMGSTRYFYALKTYSAMLLQKFNFLKPFLIFALLSNIPRIIYDLSKYSRRIFYTP